MTIRDRKNVQPPMARKDPTILTMHGDVRMDDYYWMKLSDEQKMAETPDAQTAEVVQYLEAENAYREQMMAHLEPLEDQLFEEIKGRIKEDDSSVPYLENGYYYITRYETGQEYPIHSRKKGSLQQSEEIMLDVNELAKPYDYYAVSSRKVSPDNRLLAYGEDTVSRRQYTIRIKDLDSGAVLPDVITNTTGTAIWGNDNKTLFYTRKDEALRSYKIYRHSVGTSQEEDIEVYHEPDDTYNAFVYKSKSSQYIIIGSWATLSQEYHILDANAPLGQLSLFQARQKNLEHGIDHARGQWYIRTNKDGAKNFKVMTADINATNKEAWSDLIAHRDDVFVEGFELFTDYIVVNERVAGISKVRVLPDAGGDHYIDFAEQAYTASIDVNRSIDSHIVRVGYTSMTTPSSVYDYDMRIRQLTLMKQQEVVGTFSPDDYTSERLMITARDGTQVPVSLVYKNGYQKDGKNPLLLYAYGSYGYSIDPYFSSVRLSLLDRGFAYAIAHIRGGQELGRDWYEDGKFLKKMNTFTDFIDVGKHLVDHQYAASDQLYAMGGSAGGMLMGGIANMAPDLWAGIVAAVPFVDVVTTMLDNSIPLTTGEYDEWGNPNDPIYYRYMKSYSPIDNVASKRYPSMLITTGYHDSQVQYWEPAKWLAKLRDLKTDDNPILMYCNMKTGHGGASGRFEKYREVAMEYAYLLDLSGKV